MKEDEKYKGSQMLDVPRLGLCTAMFLLTIPTAVSQQGPLTTSAGCTFGSGTSVVLKKEL